MMNDYSESVAVEAVKSGGFFVLFMAFKVQLARMACKKGNWYSEIQLFLNC